MAAPPPSASDPLIAPALAARFEAGLAAATRSRAAHRATSDSDRSPAASACLRGAEAPPRITRTRWPHASFDPASAEVTKRGEEAIPATTADDPLAVAVSGGADSMALLALAHSTRPGGVIAATFDHGLRPEGAAEAAMVAGWCALHGIPHATLHPDRALPRRNIQAAARIARYAALCRWAGEAGARFLATAHHADDQAETFLMRANRGSGPTGLAGIRRARPLGRGVTLVRPLLDWRRAELSTLAAAAAMPVVADPSNADTRFTRVRARGWLAALPELDAGQLARAASHVAAMAEDLESMADWAWAERHVQGDDVTIDTTGLPRGLCRLLVRRAVALVRLQCGITSPAFGPASNVEALLDSLQSGLRATQSGVIAAPKGAVWHFAKAPARREERSTRWDLPN